MKNLDCPRTNAAAHELEPHGTKVPADFARELERETIRLMQAENIRHMEVEELRAKLEELRRKLDTRRL